MTQQNRKSVYEMITTKVIENLEKGLVPWKKYWNGKDEMPQNIFSKKHYRGMNIFLLICQGYTSPFWATFKQVKEHGGTVKKGQHATMIVFWKVGNKKVKVDGVETESTEKTFMLRYYNVFNFEQTEGLEKYIPVVEDDGKVFDPIEAAEKIIRDYKKSPKIFDNGGDRAYYSPSLDEIHMPVKEAFESEEFYYTTLFHEAVHSTGNKKRLNRLNNLDQTSFGSESYSKEELVAEMGATYLSSMAGIGNQVIENNSAYIKNWISELKNDNTLIVFASAQAQKAADHILGETPKETS